VDPGRKTNELEIDCFPESRNDLYTLFDRSTEKQVERRSTFRRAYNIYSSRKAFSFISHNLSDEINVMCWVMISSQAEPFPLSYSLL